MDDFSQAPLSVHLGPDKIQMGNSLKNVAKWQLGLHSHFKPDPQLWKS